MSAHKGSCEDLDREDAHAIASFCEDHDVTTISVRVDEMTAGEIKDAIDAEEPDAARAVMFLDMATQCLATALKIHHDMKGTDQHFETISTAVTTRARAFAFLQMDAETKFHVKKTRDPVNDAQAN